MNPRVDFGFGADFQPHFSQSGDLVYQLFAESEIDNVYLILSFGVREYSHTTSNF